MKKYIFILLAIAIAGYAGSASAQAYMDRYAKKFVLADPSFVQLTLTAPSSFTNGAYSLFFPPALPTVAGSFLSSDLAGNLTWVSPSGFLSGVTTGATLSGNGTAGSPLDLKALTGDVSTTAGSLVTALATVNGNVGTFGSGTSVGTFTVNAKGLITAASSSLITGLSPASLSLSTGHIFVGAGE